MKFDVKDRAELARKEQERQEETRLKYAPWPKGDYDFQITSATDGISKSSGNEMITLDITLFNALGETREVKDYLVSHQQDKICAACDAVGLSHLYDAGTLQAYDFTGRTGRLYLNAKTEEWQGEKRVKNSVSRYHPAQTPASGAIPPARTQKSTDVLDDSIPF